MMFEREEERRRQYIDHTTITLTLPTRDPVLQDNFLIANLEQVKSLQASLFPIYNKGNNYNYSTDVSRIKCLLSTVEHTVTN